MPRLLPLCLAALVSLALLPCPSSAADKTGIYVAPKFIYSHAVMDKLKGDAWNWTGVGGSAHMPGSTTSGKESDDIFGGALAVGYDFFPKFKIPVRTELEYALFSEAEGETSTSSTFDTGGGTTANMKYTYKQKLDIQTLFLNAYYDFKTDTPFTPYLGAGVGLAFIKAKGSGHYAASMNPPANILGQGWSDGSTRTETNFAWNLGGGVAWEVNDLLTVDLGYRFAHLGKVKSGDSRNDFSFPGFDAYNEFSSKTEDLYMHQAMLSLRFTF